MKNFQPGSALVRTKRRTARSPVARRLAGILGWSRVGVLEPERVLYQSDAGLAARLPGVVVWPSSTKEVADVVRACRELEVTFTARGAGTGLSGGAVAASDSGIVISLTRMNQILEIDPVKRLAWVEPGVVNLDLSKATAPFGLHFAPDPSSQSVCTVGGNVAENSGGPHCLLYGATSPHVLAIEVVLPSGDVVLLESDDGLDLRGVFVGSEGMCGIATRICVRLTHTPSAIACLMARFSTPDSAARATSGIIAAGIVPAAIEMMDGPLCLAVADFLGTNDYPRDGSAVLIVEVDGMPAGVEEKVERVGAVLNQAGATEVRRAADAAERDRFWKGRKSAFGAVGRIAPNYYLHDCVVPRTKLPEVLAGVYEIAERNSLRCVNVFHAGDGNLHPLLVFDGREPGIYERVDAAGAAIVALCVNAGGALTGEHGVGLEKREYMPLLFTEQDLEAQAKVPRAFDPGKLSNPDKVFPSGSRCGDVRTLHRSASEAARAGLWV